MDISQYLFFLTTIFIFDQNSNFWRKFRFLKKISIFEENFDFWTKLWFLTKIWIFDENLDFWRKFGFLTNVFVQHFHFGKKIHFFYWILRRKFRNTYFTKKYCFRNIKYLVWKLQENWNNFANNYQLNVVFNLFRQTRFLWRKNYLNIFFLIKTEIFGWPKRPNSVKIIRFNRIISFFLVFYYYLKFQKFPPHWCFAIRLTIYEIRAFM